MKAILCRQFGPVEQLRVEELPTPEPGPGQVLVSIKAAGINYPDALLVQGRYQEKPALPFVPGSELAGIVKQVGQGVSRYAVGDRVYGMGYFGCFAEEIVMDANRLHPIPPSMDFDTAATVPVTYNTTYYALIELGRLRAGETILVLGAAGGTGIAAIQIAKAFGAHVIAAASSEEKLAICKTSGADQLINYRADDLREQLRSLTGKSGVDLVYDPVGGVYAEPALRGLGWRGRYLIIGFASGDIPSIPLNLVLLKNASLIGVILGGAIAREPELGARIDTAVNTLLQDGQIRPFASARYSLDQVPDALNALLERRMAGKAVVTMY